MDKSLQLESYFVVFTTPFTRLRFLFGIANKLLVVKLNFQAPLHISVLTKRNPNDDNCSSGMKIVREDNEATFIFILHF